MFFNSKTNLNNFVLISFWVIYKQISLFIFINSNIFETFWNKQANKQKCKTQIFNTNLNLKPILKILKWFKPTCQDVKILLLFMMLLRLRREPVESFPKGSFVQPVVENKALLCIIKWALAVGFALFSGSLFSSHSFCSLAVPIDVKIQSTFVLDAKEKLEERSSLFKL